MDLDISGIKMINRYKLIFIAIIILLCGCATTYEYDPNISRTNREKIDSFVCKYLDAVCDQDIQSLKALIEESEYRNDTLYELPNHAKHACDAEILGIGQVGSLGHHVNNQGQEIEFIPVYGVFLRSSSSSSSSSSSARFLFEFYIWEEKVYLLDHIIDLNEE